MQKIHTTIHTFSSIYKEKNCDEKEFIDCMNEFVDTEPHYIYPDCSEDIMQDIKKLIYFHDGPCHSASPYSGFCVYRGVDKHVKVLLDGQGADELFGGYLTFYIAKLKELLWQNTFISNVRAINLVFLVQNEWPERTHMWNKELLLRTLGARGYRELKKKQDENTSNNAHRARIEYVKEFENIDLENSLQKKQNGIPGAI